MLLVIVFEQLVAKLYDGRLTHVSVAKTLNTETKGSRTLLFDSKSFSVFLFKY